MTSNDDEKSPASVSLPPLSLSTGERALLAIDLLSRYHAIVPSLRALRAHQQQTRSSWDQAFLTATLVEEHRHLATGLFNHLFLLFQHQLIDVDLFCLVISRAGAKLWLEHVAPLDGQVRSRHRSPSDEPEAEHPVEHFYRRYAETGDLLLRVRKTDPALAATPAGVN